MKGLDTQETGRKYRIVMISLAFFLFVNVGVVAKVWVKSLDTDTLLQVAIGVAALAGAYAGANAWSKQAESRTEVAKIEANPDYEPEV